MESASREVALKPITTIKSVTNLGVSDQLVTQHR